MKIRTLPQADPDEWHRRLPFDAATASAMNLPPPVPSRLM
jgi:hypothetical protein